MRFIVLRFSRHRKRAHVQTDPGLQQQAFQELQKQDPTFSLPDFLERGKIILLKLNQAWVQGNLPSVRRLISNGVFTRFQTQLTLMNQQGIKNVMADLSVLSVELLAAQTDSHFDVLHIKMTAQARDIEVSSSLTMEAALQEAQKAPLVPYEEVWSFIRKRGQKSKQGIPTLQGQCPNCGATLPLSDTVKCEHCLTLVNSAEHDWVLAEITQPEEWEGLLSVKPIPGLEQLQQKDPQVSRQAIEDRASVLFWKWIEAKVLGSNQRLARFCSLPLDAESSQQALLLKSEDFHQIAVGSVDIRQIVTNEQTPYDQVSVEVRWSAALQTAEPTPFQHLFMLIRKAEAKSPEGLSSLDCLVCKGPLADSDATICPYCQTPLLGNSDEWVLQQVVFMDS